MKKLLIIIAAIALLLTLFWFGSNLLAKHIYSRTDCSQFNIDNIELRAHINIPSNEIGKTFCESNGKVKKATFVLNLNTKELEEYIIKNKFVKKGELYVNKGEQPDTKWESVLNPKSLELNVRIEYLR